MAAAEMVVSPVAFMEYFLGLSQNQITSIKQMGDSDILNEAIQIAEIPVEEEKEEIVKDKD